MTNSVNLLESKGILLRIEHSKDNRSKLVTISKKFIPTCKKIEDELRAELRKAIYTHLTQEELRAHIKALSLLASLDER